MEIVREIGIEIEKREERRERQRKKGNGERKTIGQSHVLIQSRI